MRGRQAGRQAVGRSAVSRAASGFSPLGCCLSAKAMGDSTSSQGPVCRSESFTGYGAIGSKADGKIT